MVNRDIPGPADVAGADLADGQGSGADAVPGGAGSGADATPGGAGSGADATPGGAGSGAQRGRPRSQEADRAILTATVELLADRGLAAMSIEEVAARAGVGKTTIYRRWPSKGLLALDAFVRSFREEQPLPDTGTLRGDLLAALTAYVRAVTQTPMGAMLTSLIAEAQHDPELRGAWRGRVIEPLRSQHRIMLERAVARGEIPASVDAEVVLDLFFGAAEHRLLLGHLPMTDAFIGTVVDVILGGIQPGGRPCSLSNVVAWVSKISGRHRHDLGEHFAVRAGNLFPGGTGHGRGRGTGGATGEAGGFAGGVAG